MDSKVSSSLVMISDVSPKDMRRSHNVDLMMVKNLWQAFLVSQRASKSQSDCRLEYLFWRIWSSDTLLDDMKIGQLNDLVSRIVLPGGHAAQSTTQQAQKSQAFPHIHTITGSPPHTTPQPEVRPRPAEPKAMPQPILKKSSAPQGESNKTARLLLEQPDGGSITRNPSNSPTSSVQAPQPKEPTAGRQGPKKSHFTTGARAGRRRPVFNRRKSSQASVAKTMLASSAEQQQQQQQAKPQPRQRPPLDPLESMQSFELVFDPDYVPPVEDSPPPPTPPIHKIKEEIELTKIKEALADIGSIEVPRLSSKTATATTTAATTPNALSDQTDPLLSQGLETVSYDPQEPPPLPPQGSQKKQTAEPHDANRSSNGTSTTTTTFQNPLSLPVPGFPSTRRIPIPQEMETILLNILHDESPLDGPIPLPTRPWWICEHSCSPLPRTEYLADWMLQIDDWDKQPSKATLANPGFRTRFVEAVVAARAEEEAAIALLNEVRMPSDDNNNNNNNNNKNSNNVNNHHNHNGNNIHRHRSFNRTDDEREPYHSVLSHMVGKESQESRSAREEHLKWERSEQQPDQQERQQIVWSEDSKGLHLAHSPGSARVGYLESLDPTTFL